MRMRLPMTAIFIVIPVARADHMQILPCVGPTLAAVIAQQICTVGDLTFEFTKYIPLSIGTGAGDASAEFVGFVPLTDDLSNPGFELRGPFYAASDGFAAEGGTLDYIITGIEKRRIDGITTTIQNATATAHAGPINAFSDGSMESRNDLSKPSVHVDANDFQFQYSNEPVRANTYNEGLITFPPIKSSTGELFFTASAYNCCVDGHYGGGSASIIADSVIYRFRVSTIPEPATWVLLGSVALLLIANSRRH